mgnify:CR=1 FL=1
MSDVYGAMGSALYSALAAGTALVSALGGTAIYDSVIPQVGGTRFVVFQPQAGGEDNTSPRRARTCWYFVKAVSSVGAQNAGVIDGLVDTLLHEATLTVTGWGNYRTTRESDVAYVDDTAGQLWWHRGALYRVRIAEP